MLNLESDLRSSLFIFVIQKITYFFTLIQGSIAIQTLFFLKYLNIYFECYHNKLGNCFLRYFGISIIYLELYHLTKSFFS